MKQNTVIYIPDDIFPNAPEKSESLIFHDYTAVASLKEKSVLTKNAISLVMRGEKTMHFAEKSVFIKADEFHFLSSGNCVAGMNPSNKESFRSILIFFDNSVLSDFFIKYASSVQTIKTKGKIQSRHYIAFKKDRFVSNYIASLELLLQSGKKMSAGMKLLKFEELLLHLLETHPAEFLSFQTVNIQDLNDFEIRKAVETHVSNPVSLEELAFLCHTSLSTFKRRFIKIYGMPPNKWILQKRMETARNLLLHHNEKPSDVYHKVGFENHSSFSQSFKKNFGITPKAFQQKLNVLQ
jgi:AraC-like DNA-binding protein